MTRIQSKAPVLFSNVICLQYSGTLKETSNSDCQSQVVDDSLPYIEFRIVNKNCNKSKHLLNAAVTCSALLPTSTKSNTNSTAIPDETYKSKISNQDTVSTKYELKVDVINSGYFDDVYYIRHILDKNSPLVKDSIKTMISEYGTWPSTLNDYVSMRESLTEFQKIVVLFDGIDEVTACSVYAQKCYEFEDIYIGWEFVGLSNKDKVDMNRVHNIIPQSCGGNEPLS